ncbi:T9SS C-terminal target domain-containing protein, partial [bacterium]
MKFRKVLPLLLVSALSIGTVTGITSCKKDSTDPPIPPVTNDSSKFVLKGDIAANKTLSKDSVWMLKGYVYVKDGATLTIPAGTIIKSDIIDKGAIIVERGGKIMAEGTATSPIVFTSGLPKGQRRPGDWGGIIILGKAPTNRSSEPTI